jgi:hypothetical protein
VLVNGLAEKEVAMRDGPELAVDVLGVLNTAAVEEPPLSGPRLLIAPFASVVVAVATSPEVGGALDTALAK